MQPFRLTLCCSSKHGCGRTRLVAGLTPSVVPVEEREPINEGIVESSTHEIAQLQLENVPNIEQLFNRLGQIMTIVMQNETHTYTGNARGEEL